MSSVHHPERHGHAVVIGASIAGMCAARALQQRFAAVTILEADDLPTSPTGRRGTPQSWHCHSLLGAGREAIENLFPGFTEQLVANGGRELDPGYEAANCLVHGWGARSRTNFRMFFASRPLMESTIRDQLRSSPNVTILEGVRVDALLREGDDAVAGVRYRHGHGGESTSLQADFVVDATGRGSRAALWMKDFGAEVEVMTLDAKVSYSSRWYRWPKEKPWYQWLTTFPDPDPAAPTEHQYLCAVFPIEDDSYIAVMGSWGQPMPTDAAAYEAAAHASRTREFSRILSASEPLSDVYHTRSTRNVWHRFDRLASPPRRFIAIGDAVCAFNPIYGQGISCAATAAVMLRSLLDDVDPDSPELPRAFYARQAGFLNGAWTLATTRDGGYEHATGSEALPDGWRKTLLRRSTWPLFQFIVDAGWQEPEVDFHFNQTFNLKETIFDVIQNPRVVLGLLRFGMTRLLRIGDRPPVTPPLESPPDTDYTEARRRANRRRRTPSALQASA